MNDDPFKNPEFLHRRPRLFLTTYAHTQNLYWLTTFK
jgi:hypothetical protein